MWHMFVTLLSPVFGFVVDLGLLVLHWIWLVIVSLMHVAWEALYALMPSEWTSYLSQTPWTTVLSFFSALQYFIPIKEVFSILVVAYSICGVIRLARWIMAFVPGLSIAGNSVGPFGGA